jgi:thiol-disulfide isomerase/thioredoxin
MTPLSQIAPNPYFPAGVDVVARATRLCALASALLCVVGLAVPVQPLRAADPATRSPAEAAPGVVELALPTLDHGIFDVSQQRGRWVVVNYWATWCAPCRKEMPELDALDREREDIEVLGLAFEEIEPADMRDFLAERPVSYPIAIVDVYAPPAAFEVPRGMPMTYLLDPQGRIAHRWLGPVTKAEIEARVDGGGA